MSPSFSTNHMIINSLQSLGSCCYLLLVSCRTSKLRWWWHRREPAPTSVSSGSWRGSAGPVGPPSSPTSWSWRSGSGPRPHPPSAAGNWGCLRSWSCRSARSRRWTRRCWRRRRSTCRGTRTDASAASSVRREERVKETHTHTHTHTQYGTCSCFLLYISCFVLCYFSV